MTGCCCELCLECHGLAISRNCNIGDCCICDNGLCSLVEGVTVSCCQSYISCVFCAGFKCFANFGRPCYCTCEVCAFNSCNGCALLNRSCDSNCLLTCQDCVYKYLLRSFNCCCVVNTIAALIELFKVETKLELFGNIAQSCKCNCEQCAAFRSKAGACVCHRSIYTGLCLLNIGCECGSKALIITTLCGDCADRNLCDLSSVTL